VLRLKVFGGLSIERDQGPAEGAGAQRRRLALLALLDGAGDRGLTRDKILGFLWPESEPEKARRILTQALYALRRDLREEELFLGSNEVRLNPDLMTSDRFDFQKAIEADQLERAVSCYSGPFLDGFYVPEAPEFERWVEIERATFQNQYAGALEELAAAATARGESRAAIVWWRKLATVDPHNGQVALGLMKALVASGDRSAALQHYRVFEALCRQELDLDVEPEVVVYAASLKRQVTTTPGLTPASTAPVPAAKPPTPPPPAPPLRQPISPHTDEYARPRPAPDRAIPEPEPAHRSGPDWVVAPSVAPATKRRITRPVALATGTVALLLTLGILLAMMTGRFPGRRKPPVVAVGLITDYTKSDQEMGRPLADMLATDLARSPGLQVISTARMYDLLGKIGPTTDSTGAVFRAAQEAGATELLDGTLFNMGGGRLRLDLRRTDIESGNLRQAYSVEGKDLFALVESGTRELVANLGGQRPGSSLAEATTSSLSAYRLYERGLRALFSGRPGASDLFESALEEDSSFAMAAYYLAISYGADRDRMIPAMERAVRLAQHASDHERLLIEGGWADATDDPSRLAIAETLTVRYPTEPEGYLFLGHAQIWDGDFLGALGPLRHVVSMDSSSLRFDPRSNDAPARCMACSALGEMIAAYIFADSFPAAERVARQWTSTQPGSGAAWGNLANVYYFAGRFQEALAANQTVVALAPHVNQVPFRMWLRLRSGDYATADQYFREQVQEGDPATRAANLEWLTNSLRIQGRLVEALETAALLRRAHGLNEAGEPEHLPAGSAPYSALWEAQVNFELGRYRQAAALFDSISKSGGGETPSRKARHRAWTQTLRAEALATAGDTVLLDRIADSVQVWGQQSGYGRDRRLHHHVRGLLLAARGRFTEAEAEFRAAIFSPVNGYSRTNTELAQVLLQLKRPLDAAALAESALRGPFDGPNTYVTRADLFELAGRAYDAAGKRDSALACFHRVAEAWQHADPIFAERRRHVEERIQALEASR